ncbi:MAG: TlpA family protein disulfide reductase [Planctomycetales bacterium]|nr:TlpA family protein disulfide reductase [Planctomycetales bacterium]
MGRNLQVWLGTLALMFSSAVGLRAAEPEMRIRLKDGSFGRGTLVGSDRPDQIGWMCPGFEQAFEFDLAAVRSITRILPPEEPGADSALSAGQLIEMADGATLVGQLQDMDEQWLTVHSKLLGTVKVARQQALALLDASYAGQIIYSGPVDDERWQRLSAAEDWLFQGGTLVATKAGATIVGNVQLPARSQINFSLSWQGSPDFVMSFGTLASNLVSKPEEVPSAARLEVWDRQLALVREVDGGADIAMLADLTGASPRIDLTLYLDQEAGTIVACDAHGRPLETLRVMSKRVAVRPAVHLANHGPSLTIERFEVREWDGIAVGLTAEDKPSVLDSQGNRTEGVIAGYDSENGLLLLESPAGAISRLPLADLRRGELAGHSPRAATRTTTPRDATPTTGNADDGNTAEGSAQKRGTQETVPQAAAAATSGSAAEADRRATPSPLVELILLDRTRLQGQWLAARQRELCFAANGLREPVCFTGEALRGILGDSQRYRSDLNEEPQGTLKMGENQLAGYLLSSSPSGSRSGLHWHPLGSRTASEISLSARGAIVYRHPPPHAPSQPKSTVPNRANARPNAAGLGIFLGNRATPAATPPAAARRAITEFAGQILFRSGDAVDGTVLRIDERGMSFHSSQTATDFATHEQIQHVWLNPQRSRLETRPEELQRLMTVPRSMKKDPPTHLFISTTGDYLRGRLLQLEGETITVEIRLEQTELPTAQVAEIVWLHDRDWNESKTTSAAPGEIVEGDGEVAGDAVVAGDEATGEEPFQVHAIAGNDRGLTFRPQKLQQGVLLGHSDLLGACSMPLKELSQLLFGRGVSEQVRQFRQDPWTLSLARFPRVYLEEDGGEAGLPGGGSPLVGKPAPDFALSTLDGQQFRLSKHRDRVVVLDFWASWCGPCMQTMPQVEEVVNDLGSERVQLVAVNIQESSARAEVAVKRLSLTGTVLLDSDGQTAAVYAANAIPQTVIVDRTGQVTHVFVGGGPRFVAQFRAALQSVLSE